MKRIFVTWERRDNEPFPVNVADDETLQEAILRALPEVTVGENQHFIVLEESEDQYKQMNDLRGTDIEDGASVFAYVAGIGGGGPDFWQIVQYLSAVLAIPGSLASVGQFLLMVAEQWKRRRKKFLWRWRKGAWQEVKAIHIIQENRKEITFDYWRSHPEALPAYVHNFHSSLSPHQKPVAVDFLLQSGSTVRIDVSDKDNTDELNKFIDLLNR